MSSWASASSTQAETSFVPAYGDHEDDFEMQSEEHVVALHDFNSNNATCLSFQAGQVIKVYNRDPSGWWDGELDGQRGWFPSNYVDQEAVYVSDDGQNHSFSHEDSQPMRDSATSHASSDFDQVDDYRSLAQTALARERYFSANNSRSSTPTSTPLADRGDAGVLDPILHAISLLRNAVRANRVAHFQPSTACVISSVRSVLSATDCLTRESAILKANPQLARERKAILSELSKLVAQARRASAPMVDEGQRPEEMNAMLDLAEQVLANVRNFISVAVNSGVPVPDRRSSVYDDLYASRAAPADGRNRSAFARQELDKTPTPDYPQARASVAQSHASHSSDRHHLYNHMSSQDTALRQGGMRRPYAQRRHPSDGSVESVDGGAYAIAQARFRTQRQLDGRDGRAETVAAAVAAHLGMARSRSNSSSESPESISEHDTGSHHGSAGSGEDEGPPSPVERTPYEVMQRLSVTNDQLLSIIAAFIGHVHTHTSESHASSYAHLIDMTREAVVGVRNLLLVVEAVNNNIVLQQIRPRETSILWETRENLYEATTQLVTAARIVTSAPSASITAGSAAEAEDKSRLLQAATSVLRTGGECVGAVRLCIDRLEPSFTIALPEPSRTRQPRASSQVRTSMEPDQIVQQSANGDEVRDDNDAELDPAREARRKNTLSFLGRKATSLSCLKQKYERDEHSAGFEDIEEDERSVEESDMSRLSNSSMQQPPRPAPTAMDRSSSLQNPGAYAIDRNNDQFAQRRTNDIRSSGPKSASMASSNGSAVGSSADHLTTDAARTSRSTIQSIRSECTGETSARPSFELQQQGAGSVPDAHTTAQTAAKQLAGGVVDRQSMYREQRGPAISIESRYMAPDYDPSDVVCNSEGQVTGATLKALVEKMTPHDTMVEATFSTAFFLCFRMFTSPQELLDTLVARFEMKPPVDLPMSEADIARWNEKKLIPVRLRVLNLLKSWLENHWNPVTDRAILQQLISLSERWASSGATAGPAHRLADLARKRNDGATQKTTVLVGNSRGPGSLQRVISSERMKGGFGLAMTDASQMYAPSAFSKGGAPPPSSVVSKALLANLRNENFDKINVLDFDPMELARQLTILDSKLYCAIQPEELLGAKFSKETKAAGVSEDVHVKSMSSMSTRITGWISECILCEADARKRTQLLKFFIKLSDRCEQLNNFHTLMAIQCALNSSTIARLKKTWDGLSTKYKGMMDQQRRAVEHTRNYAGYRARLRNTTPPAIPFLGLFLTDLTFCHEGNAATRPCPANPEKKLLNFDKYIKISRIVGEVQRFQVPYNLVEVPEMQKFLKGVLDDVQGAQGGRGADDLYRRSLLLEPRTGSKATAPAAGSASTSGTASMTGSLAMRATNSNNTSDGSKLGGLDIFNWRTDKA